MALDATIQVPVTVTLFSQRIGRAIPKMIQVDAMDDDLRNSLWNAILDRYDGYPSRWHGAAAEIAKHVVKERVDSFSSSENGSQAWLRNIYFTQSWDRVYDIVEFLVANVDAINGPGNRYGSARFYAPQRGNFTLEVNRILERELSAYRFINGILVPISSTLEVASIESALGSSGGSSEHLRTALALLGQKPVPDYRNSIKESISAVESIVNEYAGTDANGVAKAVESLAAKVEIHPALRTAVKQLYGYSSDADGIRHAILDQADIGYAEAAFMLVACSAFVNFFRDKASQATLLR